MAASLRASHCAFLAKPGRFWRLPAFICIPADVIENTVQLFILSGDESLIWLKAIMTPLKLATFIPAAIIALVGLGIALYRRFIRKSDAPAA